MPATATRLALVAALVSPTASALAAPPTPVVNARVDTRAAGGAFELLGP